MVISDQSDGCFRFRDNRNDAFFDDDFLGFDDGDICVGSSLRRGGGKKQERKNRGEKWFHGIEFQTGYGAGCHVTVRKL